MALPPPWIVLADALSRCHAHLPKDRAIEMVEHLESRGWRIVPAHAVNESALRVGLAVDTTSPDAGRGC